MPQGNKHHGLSQMSVKLKNISNLKNPDSPSLFPVLPVECLANSWCLSNRTNSLVALVSSRILYKQTNQKETRTFPNPVFKWPRVQSVTSPQTSVDKWTNEAVDSILCYVLTRLLQKSTDNFAASKNFKSTDYGNTLSQAVLIHPNLNFPTSQFHPLCPSFYLAISPSLSSFTAATHEVVIRLMWSHVEVLQRGFQFQVSEADPLLVMALRGLRDTEPLFFQRTFPRPAGSVELFVLAWELDDSSTRFPFTSPCGSVAEPSCCQSLSACWKECARQAVMSRARSARLHQNTRHCSCCPWCLQMYKKTLGRLTSAAQYAMSCRYVFVSCRPVLSSLTSTYLGRTTRAWSLLSFFPLAIPSSKWVIASWACSRSREKIFSVPR